MAFAPQMTCKDFDTRVLGVRQALVARACRLAGACNGEDRVQCALLRAWPIRADFATVGADQLDWLRWCLSILKFECATFLREQMRHPVTSLPPVLIFDLMDGPATVGLASDQWCAQRQEMYRRLTLRGLDATGAHLHGGMARRR